MTGLLPALMLSVLALAFSEPVAAQNDDPDVKACSQRSGDAFANDAVIKPALAACTRVIERRVWRGKQEAAAYTIRGYWKHRAKDHQGALKDFDRAIKINKDWFEAYDYRADLHAELGNDKKALADYEQATRIDPNYAAAYFSRGKIYEKLGDFVAARTAYERTMASPRRDRIAEWAQDGAKKRLETLGTRGQ